jgi:hypothetical protein
MVFTVGSSVLIPFLVHHLQVIYIYVKLKVNLVHALRLCTDCTTHRGSRVIALLFHDHGTRRGLGVSVTPRPHFTPGKDPVPIVQEAAWVPGPVWTGTDSLASTRIQSTDRPARSQSLYQLRYPAHIHVKCTLVQALRLCTGCTTHRGSTGIALHFHDQWH